jgi:cation diffusion facilitator family transporter
VESAYKLRILRRSTIAIASVVFVEITLGVIVGSLAIVSDGIHAMLDAVTTLMLFIVTRASLKPPDEEHMYGHEKFEAIGGLVGGITLTGIGILIIYEAILKILGGQNIATSIEYVGFIAIGYTFCIDFFRVRTLLKARETESSTMKAGFYHALADLSSTIIAFLGFGLATLGFAYGDALASIALGVLLSCLSVRLVWNCGMELTDTISKDVADLVRKEIVNAKGVLRCGDLKIRKAGGKTFVRATVQVPDYMSLEDAHNLSTLIETNLQKALGNVDVAIHIEPHEAEMRTEKLVEALAIRIKGVKKAHEVTVAQADSKLYITLHAEVDPKLSVQETHEIAEKIENEIFGTIRDIENVTVHIEPFTKIRKGSMVDEKEIHKIIHKAAETHRQNFRIKRIITYIADKKRFINLEGCFTGEISTEDAHTIISNIEERIREHFAETIITVHMEPE